MKKWVAAAILGVGVIAGVLIVQRLGAGGTPAPTNQGTPAPTNQGTPAPTNQGTPAPTISTQGLGAGGTPAPTGVAPGPFKAVDGSIYTDKLFLGVLALDDSDLTLTVDQAKEVLRVIGLLENKLRKNEYYDERIEALATPAQRAFMEEQGRTLTQDVMHERFTPEHIHAVVDEVERIAGTKRPEAELELPADLAPPNRPNTVSRMTLFMISFDLLQQDPALAIGKAQAAAMLPVVDSYVRLKSMHQQTKRDILACLTDAQKAWIDAHPPASLEIRDMTVLTAELKAKMQKKVGS